MVLTLPDLNAKDNNAMKYLYAVAAALLTGCGNEPTHDLPITVDVVGSDVVYSWEHGPASDIIVRYPDDTPSPQPIVWMVLGGYENVIPSPVTHGVLSPAMENLEVSGTLEPLVSGTEYLVEVSLCYAPDAEQPGTPLGPNACWVEYAGSQTFTAP